MLFLSSFFLKTCNASKTTNQKCLSSVFTYFSIKINSLQGHNVSSASLKEVEKTHHNNFCMCIVLCTLHFKQWSPHTHTHIYTRVSFFIEKFIDTNQHFIQESYNNIYYMCKCAMNSAKRTNRKKITNRNGDRKRKLHSSSGSVSFVSIYLLKMQLYAHLMM